MDTRLARYCDRVLEAGWLAAAMLAPLFFNVHSSRVFEPDKLTLLRSIALVMAAAWLVRALERARSAGGERGEGLGVGLRQALSATPLAPHILLLVAAYFLATLLSVAPRTSFWGSYQRLQGAYTMMAYIVVFFITWHSLRTRAQLERLLNTIVLTSLPVALYGVLQHYGMDPLPWAGDVQDRVTGNLGNAIFMAAYLILAFFVTLERVVARFRVILGERGSGLGDAVLAGGYLFILALQVAAIYFTKSRGPWLGLLAGFYFFMLVALVALRRSAALRGPLRPAEAAKAFAFALLSPLVGAIPAYVALILARRGRRWLWLSWCLQAVLAFAFLVVFNLPQSPLAGLRQVPGVGRLGQVFETEGGTGRVRVLIWQGAVQLVASDPLRALVGYGPESMFVAFNRVYPPELGHLESRQASPDRSHNETFDALITTGAIGFLAYILLFGGIFLYGLRWLGFLPEAGAPGRARSLFLGLAAGGAALGVLVPLALDHSLRFAGVGLPVGLILGVAIYLAAAAFASSGPPTVPPTGGNRVQQAGPVARAGGMAVGPIPSVGGSEGQQGRPAAPVGGSAQGPIPPVGGTVGGLAPQPTAFGDRELLLASLLALIVAHFVEIHFGIAIAATRLYFWLALALLISLGTRRLDLEPELAPVQAPRAIPEPSRRRRRRGAREVRQSVAAGRRVAPLWGPAALGALGALMLGTVLYGFTTNVAAQPSPVRVLWASLTTLQFAGEGAVPSPGLLALVFLTWVLGALWVVGEGQNLQPRPPRAWWLQALALYGSVALGGALAFALVHASQLQPRTDVGSIIYLYYAYAFGALLVVAVLLPGPRSGEAAWRGGWRAALYPLLVGAIGLMVWRNATVVRADMYYKQGWDGFHRPASEALAARAVDRATALRYYDAALRAYDQALACAPEEDYYLLFKGKALLERSELAGDAQARLRDLQACEAALRRAQALNPLNPDHTANLARLYRTWAAASSDAASRQAMLEEAARHYEQVTRLSPHSAALFNEWGQTLLDLGRPEEALARYQQSLALDDRFAQTYLLLAEHALRAKDPEQAARYAAQAVAVDPASAQVHSSVGYLYSQMGRVDEAIREYQQVLAAYPKDFVTQKNLAILYSQAGRIDQALAAAQAARAVAPESERAGLDQFIAQLQAGQGKP